MTTTDENAAPARAGAKEWAGLAVLALPVLLLAIDLNVLHLAAPALGADLGTSSTQLLWILDVYGFMVAGFLVTMGNLGDRIGRRRLLLIGAAAFGAASVVAAYAPSAEALIAARALLGIAGATLMPSTLGLIGNMFHDPKQRSTAIGVWIMAFIGGSAVGPIAGGLLLEQFWWGAAFLMNVPVMVLLLAAGPLLLTEFRDESAGRIDLPSALLALATMLPVVYAAKEFAKDGFEPATVAVLAVGLLSGALFLRRQRRLDDPLVDLRLFRSRGFGAALAVLLLVTSALGGMLMLFVQFLQMVEGLSALESGLWMLPGVAASILASALAPVLAQRVRPAVVIGAGLALALAGAALFMRVEADGGLAPLIAGTVLMFLGMTPVAVLGTDLVVGAAPKERASSAGSLSETASELGSALSIALIGSVITAVYTGRMAAASLGGGVPEAARDNLAAALASAEHLPEEEAAGLLEAGREAFTQALNVGALASAAILLAAFAITAVALRRVPPLGRE
ncbi:MFS transporter [Glycomyces sp. A-F 0318]|uniref:MFS transporter n=1 Tax=Glycomyces amatae TaxID=2881355 RepID=UPI001E522EA4|nr:MFS transporter [Glycomyces amatae]MCD0444040.1 MFS transporter [Glycomyces amatae]